jgi:hypothetical protein
MLAYLLPTYHVVSLGSYPSVPLPFKSEWSMACRQHPPSSPDIEAITPADQYVHYQLLETSQTRGTWHSTGINSPYPVRNSSR